MLEVTLQFPAISLRYTYVTLRYTYPAPTKYISNTLSSRKGNPYI